MALEKGHFKAENLEVTIEPGNSPTDSITRVASGAYDIGFGDINTLIRYRDQNPGTPVKAVFVVNNRPSYAIIGRKSRGVARVRDLEGMRLGAPAAEPATAAWPIVAKARGVDVSKVTVINVGVPVREPMLAAGEVDAITGSSASSPINLRAKGVPADDVVVLLMSERGLELYGASIFVNTKVLAEKPEAVKGFLRAFVLGLKDTLRDPAAAIDSVVRRVGAGQRDVEAERLRVTIRDSILTPEVASDGLGGIEDARFARALDQIAIGYAYKNNKPKVSDIFDPSFLPSEAARKLD
jgi:NitT/TauT family transport system substrate-binding protein